MVIMVTTRDTDDGYKDKYAASQVASDLQLQLSALENKRKVIKK